MFLYNTDPIFFFNIRGWAFIRGSIYGKICLKKSAFLASKLGNGPLLEHGPLIEILRYIKVYISCPTATLWTCSLLASNCGGSIHELVGKSEAYPPF